MAFLKILFYLIVLIAVLVLAYYCLLYTLTLPTNSRV